jgi:AAA+ ATPase superfamily predicted ATPase
MRNPFIINTYLSPVYFCDRETETERLKDALENGRNIVLLSLRRMGKTGLIKHLFYRLRSDKNTHTFYVDIMGTNSTEEFVNKLADSVLGYFNTGSKKMFDQVFRFFSKFNPVITFDALTGVPSVELKPHSEQQAQNSLFSILEYLEGQKQRIYIAIDEFQQITSYKDTGFEAFLRSHIQHLKNVNFIFSGSQQHLLTSMFTSHSRPFYQSTDFLKLERIDQTDYINFINRKFKNTGKIISKQMISELLEWTDLYTFYVQNTFNKLWYISGKKVSEDDLIRTRQQILEERNYIYLNLHNLLPKAQFDLLRAIAINKGVEKPTSKEFVNTYFLGTPSTVSTALKTLQNKEMIYKEKNLYKIYDVFMEKWFEENS